MNLLDSISVYSEMLSTFLKFSAFIKQLTTKGAHNICLPFRIFVLYSTLYAVFFSSLNFCLMPLH